MNRLLRITVAFFAAISMLAAISRVSAATIMRPEVTVVDVTAISDITVNSGTDLFFVKYRLPMFVKAALSNGLYRYALLFWDNGTPAYNGNVSGTYTFTAPLNLSGVIVPDNFKTVQARVIVSNIIAKVDDVNPIFITCGTSLENAVARLPQSINVTLMNGSSMSTTVTWENEGSAYDGSTVGANYTFTGTLILPSDIKNPYNLKAQASVLITKGNNDPNPNTTLNTSAGTTLFEFDSAEDLKPSSTASLELDANNSVSGTASIKTSALAPIVIEGQNTSFYNLQTTETVNDRLREMKNVEFNLFIPDKSQIDYIVINFYTDSSHNYFFQNAIGVWELSPGWNKIRRPLSDFYFVNSIPSISSNSADNIDAILSKESKYLRGAIDEATEKSKLRLKVDSLNNMLGKINSTSLMQNSKSINALTVPSTWDYIDNMEIFVASKVNSVPKVNFDRIAYNVSGSSKLLFTFDDSWYDVKQYAEPILSAKGYKATLWANMTDSVESNQITERGPLDVMNEADLTELYAKGWDIGNHSTNHVDNVTLLSKEQMRNEYLTNQNWLLSNGWLRGAYHVCYPSGSYNDTLIEVLKEIGAKSGRCTEYGITPTPVYNIYKLKTVFISRDTNVADIKAQIDKAVNTGSSLFFMLHRVEENPIYTNESEYNPLAVSTEKFSQIVEYVSSLEAQGLIDVDTISEWYEEYMN